MKKEISPLVRSAKSTSMVNVCVGDESFLGESEGTLKGERNLLSE
jgi:hypothetical protein